MLKHKHIDIFSKKNGKTFTIIDLFRYSSLRKYILPFILLNFISTYLLSSAPLLLDNSFTTLTNPFSLMQVKGSIVDGLAWIASALLA
jgi:hypothetical protein